MAVNVGTTDPNIANDVNSIITERRDIPFGKTIVELETDAAPLTKILGQSAKKPTSEVEYRWFESTPLNRWLPVTQNAPDDVDTEITGIDTSGIYPRDLLRLSWVNPVDDSLVEELVRVVSVDSDSKITISRNYSGSGAQDFSNANEASPLAVVVIGNISQEGSRAPEDRNKQPVVKRNVTGIQKTPFAVTGSLDASRQKANPQERARLQKYWGIEHLKQLEQMLLFGELVEDLSGGAPERVTRGVVSFIESNIFDMEGSITYDKFIDYAQELFQYGDSSERWMFAGGGFITGVAKIGTDKIRIETGESEYGVKFERIITPHGDFKLVRHRMLRGPVWGNAAICLDISTAAGEPLVQYRPLNGRDTTLQLNIQANDEDAVRDQYMTEAGFQLVQEVRHALFFNAG